MCIESDHDKEDFLRSTDVFLCTLVGAYEGLVLISSNLGASARTEEACGVGDNASSFFHTKMTVWLSRYFLFIFLLLMLP